MTILTARPALTPLTQLPPLWPLLDGETPCPAAEAAAALLEIVSEAADDSEAGLAQLGGAQDVTPEAVELGVRLRQLLAECRALAAELVVATD